jgi:MarR family transcriptional regulator, organic hydroperoxide resistance regulator
MPHDASRDDFSAAWEDFFRAVRRAKGRAAARPPATGLSTAQYQLLAPLSAEPAQTIRALAEAAGVAAPTATRMLDGLERDGYVTRAPAETDRRRVEVDLTQDGRRALEATREVIEAARRRISDSLSAEDRAQAARLLHRLAEVVEEQLP